MPGAALSMSCEMMKDMPGFGAWHLIQQTLSNSQLHQGL